VAGAEHALAIGRDEDAPHTRIGLGAADASASEFEGLEKVGFRRVHPVFHARSSAILIHRKAPGPFAHSM
jgi:hypothetical protein